MLTESLLDDVIDSVGQAIAEVQREFRADTRVITAEMQSKLVRIESDVKDCLQEIRDNVAGVLATVKSGENGQDGRDAPTLAEVVTAILPEVTERAIAALPVVENGKDGQDGRDADVEEIAQRLIPEVERAVASLPKPENGKDGKDADPVSKEMLAEVVSKAIPSLIVNEDGHLVQLSVNGEVKSLGRVRGKDGVDGVPGAPGQDGKAGERGADAPDLSYVSDDLSVKTALAIRMLAEKPVLTTTETAQVPVQQREIRKHFRTWRDNTGALQGEMIEVPV